MSIINYLKEQILNIFNSSISNVKEKIQFQMFIHSKMFQMCRNSLFCVEIEVPEGSKLLYVEVKIPFDEFN